MRVWVAAAVLAVVLAVGISACGSGSVVNGPPEVRYGEDVCDECRMIISDARFAAAYVTAGGDVRRFDDIGDMVVYFSRVHEDVVAFWVHDYGTKVWLRAEEASFVRSSSVQTPMGHGLVAFASRGEAEAFVREHGGEIVEFGELFEQ
ncbi:MAG: nitrous oxide reductase accessory protein NosL [Ardenticatenia bacterium]|nr:nitrous oxide reductase accessory protein NosL [Ardenticatenia bacterium]